jgi:predicted AAA+ superfamily ATPase
MFRNVYPREKYLSRIRPFYDSDIIKVITGIRRCGKSFILRGIINELLAIGKPEESIVYVPLDQRGFKSIKTPDTLHGEDSKATDKIKEREYKPFRSIQDGYPRYIISLDRFRDQQEGVHHINAIDLLLGKERIGEA